MTYEEEICRRLRQCWEMNVEDGRFRASEIIAELMWDLGYHDVATVYIYLSRAHTYERVDHVSITKKEAEDMMMEANTE